MSTEQNNIIRTLSECEARSRAATAALSGARALVEYAHFTRPGRQNGRAVTIWTAALQAAINENQIVTIPASHEPYYIDGTVTVPSHRHIIADKDACICLTADTDVLMLRNVHTLDGTHAPIADTDADCNIAITGGVWAESRTARAGYGQTGKKIADPVPYIYTTRFEDVNGDGASSGVGVIDTVTLDQ